MISRLGEIIAHDISFEPCANVFDQRVEVRGFRGFRAWGAKVLGFRVLGL